MLFNTESFFVSLENVFLEAWTIKCEVSQGSILEPLLFLLYINYISQAMSNSHTYLYADDTSIFFINIKTLRKSKVFLKNNLQMYAIGLLIISYQFILRRWNLMDSLQYGKKLLELNITYNHNRIKQSHIVEYPGCCLNTNLRI